MGVPLNPRKVKLFNSNQDQHKSADRTLGLPAGAWGIASLDLRSMGWTLNTWHGVTMKRHDEDRVPRGSLISVFVFFNEEFVERCWVWIGQPSQSRRPAEWPSHPVGLVSQTS